MRTTRTLTIIAAVAIGGALVPAVAGAVPPACTKAWAAPTSGAWLDAARWSPAGVPNAADIVCVSVPGTYTVTVVGQIGAKQVRFDAASATISVVGNGVAGSAALLPSSSAKIGGTVVLTSTGGGWGSRLATGSLTITGKGKVVAAEGTGGQRIVSARLVKNGGVMQIDAPTTFTVDSSAKQGPGLWTNNKSIAVSATGSLGVGFATPDAQIANGPTGTIANAGSVLVQGPGRFGFGGSTSGTPVRVRSVDLRPFATVLPAGVNLVADGASSLSGNVPADVTIALEGNGVAGNASLAPAVPVANFGTIRLTSTGGGWASGIAAGSTLTNAGTLSAVVGSGGARFVRSNVVNNATLTVETGTPMLVDQPGALLTNAGSLTVDGSLAVSAGAGISAQSGSISGAGNVLVTSGTTTFTGGAVTANDVRLRNSTLAFASGATTTGATFVTDGSSALTGDVPAKTTIVVEGNGTAGTASLSPTAALKNAGTIRFTSVGGGWASGLGTGGTVTNAGTITAQAGTAGARFVRTNVKNGGTITVEAGAAAGFDQAGTLLTNTGTVSVAGSLGFSNGAGVVATSGSIAGAGTVLVNGGPVTFSGGTVSAGELRLRSSSLTFSPAAATSGATFVTDATTTLSGDVPANATVTVEGNGSTGISTLSVPAALTNRGAIVLTSAGGGWNSGIAGDAGVTITNLGSITSQPGSGGTRFLRVTVDNQSSLTANAPTVVDEAGRTITNSSTLSVPSSLSLSAGAGFVQAAGTTSASGSLFQSGGTLTLSGGTLAGNVRGRNVTLVASGTPAGASVVTLEGSSTLGSDIPNGLTVNVEGNGAVGNTSLTSAAARTSRGALVLTNAGGSWNSTVTVTGGLTNRGTVSVTGASGTHTIVGNVTNFGTVGGGSATPLTISGSLVQSGANPTVRIDVVNGAIGGVNATSATLGGRLSIVTSGTLPALGATGVAMSSASGTFATVQGTAIDVSRKWSVTYPSGQVRLTVVPA